MHAAENLISPLFRPVIPRDMVDSQLTAMLIDQ
jgi:hypothetical protein